MNYSSHKNNCQKIYPVHFVITKRDSILRGSCFCEKYTYVDGVYRVQRELHISGIKFCAYTCRKHLYKFVSTLLKSTCRNVYIHVSRVMFMYLFSYTTVFFIRPILWITKYFLYFVDKIEI